MSGPGRKKIKIGDAIIEYDEPVVPDPKAEAVTNTIVAGLAKFERHKEPLLDALRSGYERGGKSEAFDEAKSWSDLRFHAGIYLLRKSAEHEQLTMPAADRKDRLRGLIDALGSARLKMDEVMQGAVRTDLYSAWCKGTSDHSEENEQPEDLTSMEREFEKVVAGLTTLHTAALRAIEDVPNIHGRPSGTGVLPYSFVSILARHYAGSTGAKPGAGPGRFAKFVKEVVSALGHDLPEQDVITLIKKARKWDLEVRIANTSFSPTPFNQKAVGEKTPPSSR